MTENSKIDEKKGTIFFKIDNSNLIPRIRGNIFSIHERKDINFNEPLVIIEFENHLDLEKFTKKLCCQTNLAFYLKDVTKQNEIKIL